MMICVVIKGATVQEAHQQISKALAYAKVVELRLDCFEKWEIAALEKLRVDFSIPMIFTLRSQSQGGNYTQPEHDRMADIRRLMTLKPEYLDLEYDVSPSFIEEISSHYPGTKLILSYHHFTETPEDLEGLYQGMQKIAAFFYKIAVMPRNCLDVMRLVCWAKECNDDRLIAISMGTHGQISRVLAPVMRYPMTYAALEENEKTAPGQLSAKTVMERYHYRSLNSQTLLYGLMGDPVDQSISDETHNHLMTTFGLDAVYVKMQVASSELADFLQFAKCLPFHGLSVTMPLKELILPHLDGIDSQAMKIGAVNTLVLKEGRFFGYNTDGVGALNSIERTCLVKNKRMVIIGAGGAAKAIAYEALQRGGQVTIINRDERKSLEVAECLHCIGKGLKEMFACAEAGYDILVNCTPVALPIHPDHIIPNAIVMDIKTRPKDTALLKHAREKGCRVIYGEEMFIEQAVEQFDLWLKGRVDVQKMRDCLRRAVSDAGRRRSDPR